MAFAINTAYTLPEIMRSRAPDGSALKLIDVLSASVPLVEEAHWEQANGDTTHELLRVSSEPTGTLVRLNEGTPNTASTSVPVSEPLCILEDRMQIDVRAIRKAPDPIAFRREREAVHFRGLTKTFHNIAFAKGGYGSRGSDLKSIDGLSTRYGALVADSVKSNGGSGSSTLASIWIVKHGLDGLMFTYPKTASRLLKVTDMGEQPAFDASGNRYEVVMSKFEWEFGMALNDTRAVKRLCNIAPSSTGSFDSSTGTTEDNIIDLIETLPQGNTDNTAIYCGAKMMAAFRKRINTKSNLYFTMETLWGRPQLMFMGIPIIRVDALAADESTIS